MPETWKPVLLWALVLFFALAQPPDLEREVKNLMRLAAAVLLCYNLYSIRLRKR